MNDKDKDLLREDDTGSFEAMELRLKTPRKPVLVDMLSRSEKDVGVVSSADKGKQVNMFLFCVFYCEKCKGLFFALHIERKSYLHC